MRHALPDIPDVRRYLHIRNAQLLQQVAEMRVEICGVFEGAYPIVYPPFLHGMQDNCDTFRDAFL